MSEQLPEKPEEEASSIKAEPLTTEISLSGKTFEAALTVQADDIEPSGTNGPQNAHVGANFHIEKPGWNRDTTAVGEVDGLVIHTRQGGPGSDTSGLLINTAGTGEGFINGIEIAVSRVEPNSDLTTDSLSQQIGIINQTGHTLYGYHAGLNMKSDDNMAIAYNIDGAAPWDVYFKAANFSIDGKGHVNTAGSLTVSDRIYLDREQTMWIKYSNDKVLIGAGSATLLAVDQEGNLFLKGKLLTERLE